jgi:hypothetical protein
MKMGKNHVGGGNGVVQHVDAQKATRCRKGGRGWQTDLLGKAKRTAGPHMRTQAKEKVKNKPSFHRC